MRATPEDSGLSGEDGAERFRADEDGDVVHAVRVVAAVEHPGGAGRERLLPIRELRHKRQRTEPIAPLQPQQLGHFSIVSNKAVPVDFWVERECYSCSSHTWAITMLAAFRG